MNTFTDNRPPFWLQIRKDYIIENFEELVNYISKYNYNYWEDNTEYDSTVNCLIELSDDIGNKLLEVPVYQTPSLDGMDIDLAGRIFAVTLFACFKKNIAANNVLLYLIKVLSLTKAASTEENLKKYLAITVNCLRGCKITNLGFSQRDLLKNTYLTSLPTALTRLAFETNSDENDTRAIENHGVCVVSDNAYLDIAPMNYNDFHIASRRGDQIKTQICVADMIRLRVTNRDFTKDNDYECLDNAISSILKMMDAVRPSPKTTKKKYAANDENIMVRILKVDGNRIEAETVDPAYEKINGKLYIPPQYLGRPSAEIFRKYIQPGTYVQADYKPNAPAPFYFKEDFEDFFRTRASKKANTEEYVVFDSEYNTGTIWITRDGIRVSIENDKFDSVTDEIREIFYQAAETGAPVKIRFYYRAPDFNADNFRMFAAPSDENYMMDSESYVCNETDYFSVEDADSSIVEDYLETTRHSAEDLMTRSTAIFTPASVTPLKVAMGILNSILSQLATSRERLEYLGISLMMAKITDSNPDFLYFRHLRSYLRRLIAFAHNKEISLLEIDPMLGETDFAADHKEIIDKLSEYRREPQQRFQIASQLIDRIDSDSCDIDKIDTLIKASNSLIDIIDTSEVNNIKHKIAKILKVDDEYESILDNRTYYGKESISLELKKSIVFPPANRRRFSAKVFDPDLQKWEILKAVCGFLNSRAGGELLLGVSDDGYAWGIEEDIKGLVQNKMIKSAEQDQYRHYVQRVLTNAFRTRSGNYENSDVARLCITYTLEDNPENKTVLRIKVNPFPYDIVEIALDNIPEGYVCSYVRQSAETVRLTEALRRTAEAYKRDSLKNNNSYDILLQQAIEERKVVILINYRSASREATRHIHVYRYWPDRKTIYGYDIDAGRPRLFRTSRCEQIILTEDTWERYLATPNAEIDVFGLLIDKDNSFNVEMLLSEYAAMLLKEEFPASANHLSPNTKSDRNDYPVKLVCTISNPAGFLRFARGLPNDVKYDTSYFDSLM